MGCLFGYWGEPADGLLERMAKLLAHRCARGWERTRISIQAGQVVEIGHGIAPWCRHPQAGALPDRRLALGYAGVLFTSETSPTSREMPRAWEPGRVEQSRGVSGEAAWSGNGDGAGLGALLGALAEDPGAALTSLDGGYVAALARDDELILGRDPSGVKVLYWARHPGRLLFASEVKALFGDARLPRKLRLGALPEYFTFSFIPGEGTMFEGVHELQPGTILRCRPGAREALHRYFTFEGLEPEDGSELPESHYAERVRTELERSVSDCCRMHRQPPAVFLSGGIDSSAVLAVTASRFPDRPIKTYSVHFGDKYVNENPFVSLMVERYGTDHTWLEIRPKRFQKRMREIIWGLDEPIGDPITVPNFLLAETAARESRVVLNGEGGDPCFGGPKNISMLLARIYGPLSSDGDAAWMERHYLHSYRRCFADLEHLLAPVVLRESGGTEALTAILTPFFQSARPRDFLNKLMTINIRLKGANLILVKVDKMSSANGILALPPLFTRRMVETSMACPPRVKLIGNVEKGVLKKAVEDLVPMPIIARPKSGMMVPVRFWFQGEMRRYAKRVLSRRNLNRVGLFNTAYVRKLLAYDKAEIQGARHGLKLWMLVTFMLWYEQMIEGFKS